MNKSPKKIWTDPLFWHSIGGTYTDRGVEIQKTAYIREDLAQPEVKREALNEETIRWTYEKTEKNLRIVTLTEYGWFDAGVRFAEKHHGIGGEEK